VPVPSGPAERLHTAHPTRQDSEGYILGKFSTKLLKDVLR